MRMSIFGMADHSDDFQRFLESDPVKDLKMNDLNEVRQRLWQIVPDDCGRALLLLGEQFEILDGNLLGRQIAGWTGEMAPTCRLWDCVTAPSHWALKHLSDQLEDSDLSRIVTNDEIFFKNSVERWRCHLSRHRDGYLLLLENRTEMHSATRMLNVFSRLTKLLGSSLQWDETIGAFFQIAIPELGDHAVVWWFDDFEKFQSSRFSALANVSENVHQLLENEDLPLRVIQSSQSLFFSGGSLTFFDPEIAAILQPLLAKVPSVFCLPLKSGDNVFGAVTFVSELRALNLEDYAIAQELVGRTSSALQNVRLYQELRAAQGESKEARKVAETANRAKSLFLANMSHEIRTPLTAIMGFTDLILDFSSPDGLEINAERVSEWAQKIKTNGEHLQRVIEEILDISKVESGKMEFELQTTPIRPLLQNLMSTLRPAAEKRRNRLRIVQMTSIPEVIETDATRLRQIILNVVGNAIKFTEEGVICVELRHLPETQHLAIQVHDSGVGLSASQAQKLFQPFTQADLSHTRKFGGTGLGLSLSRRLALHLGGDVRLLRSEEGVGSVFEILVGTGPLHGVSFSRFDDEILEPARGVWPMSSTHIFASLKGVRVLLVEDSPDNQQLISLFLERAGAQIDTAKDGGEALAKGLSDKSDVILMDVQMPIMNGYEVTQRLRQAGISRPIFALTAHAQIEERQMSLQAGCDEHVSKPVNYQQLISLIAKYAGGTGHPQIKMH